MKELRRASGRSVSILTGTPGSHALRVAWLALKKFMSDDMPTYSAALAYRLLFSLFPFLVFLTTLVGFLGVPQFFEWMREQATYVLPAPAMAQVNAVLGELQAQQAGLMSVAIAVSVWSASAGMLGTMNALNVAYDVKERRAGWKRFIVSILYTLALAVMLLTAAGAMIAGPAVLTWVAAYAGIDSLLIALWSWLRWPIAVLILLAVVVLVYWAAPNVRQRFRVIIPGALIAVSAWIGASLAFGFYVQNFASYSKTYGSMGAVIVLLFYLFLSAAVMLYGAEVNAVLARVRGERIEEAEKGEDGPPADTSGVASTLQTK
jgi:membrane protein